MRLKLLRFVFPMLTAFHLCLASFCTGRRSCLTLAWSKAPASARFFSTSFSQWILMVSRMSSSPVPMGTPICSSSDPANCLYNTFTSCKWQYTLQVSSRGQGKHTEFQPAESQVCGHPLCFSFCSCQPWGFTETAKSPTLSSARVPPSFARRRHF